MFPPIKTQNVALKKKIKFSLSPLFYLIKNYFLEIYLFKIYSLSSLFGTKIFGEYIKLRGLHLGNLILRSD